MANALETLAKNLKLHRGAYTQEDFAKKLGMNIGVIRRIETCQGFPNKKNLEKLAKALGVEETDLFNPGDPPKPVKVPPSIKDTTKILKTLIKFIMETPDGHPNLKRLEKILRAHDPELEPEEEDESD